VGARALPSALLNASTGNSEVERLRLENETLSAVVGVVASGPDLPHILDRVVDLLSRATDCHACFVYLRSGERLEMRAASPVYSHLVGRISFGVDQGLAGWVVREETAAFIRDAALDDERHHYVAELEEERFQSLVAIPIPSRAADAIGAIVLHTVAPREFDERILNVLSRAASLVAGAIENARLYEEATERVATLTRLARFGGEIAAVGDRAELFTVAAGGIRRLLGADSALAYRAEGPGDRLTRIGAEPPSPAPDDPREGDLIEELLGVGPAPVRLTDDERLGLLGIEGGTAYLQAAELLAGGHRVGAIVVAAQDPWSEDSPEVMRAAAQLVALADEKIGLIEHLTEENLGRDLFDSLAAGELERAGEKLEQAGLPPGRPRFVIEAVPIKKTPASEWSGGLEREIRSAFPHSFLDLSSGSLRAAVQVDSEGPATVRTALAGLDGKQAPAGMAIGVSEARTGVDGLAAALREARDAAKVAAHLELDGEALLYRDSGAYRYLIGLMDGGGLQDHLRRPIEILADYDRERGAHLLATLDDYLSNGRSLASTARNLYIHVNTLRQRLDRIEELSGLSIAQEDLLALQLAVKLGRIGR
jgi:hypothetical protein